MTWNKYENRTIIITEGNAFALARELSKLDSNFGPSDYIPFLKERLGHEYEVRELFDEAFHWGFHQRIKQTMEIELEENTIQLTIDEDGDFDLLRLPKHDYLQAAENRRINAKDLAPTMEVRLDGTLRCPLHKKYKGVKLTERAKTCPGCLAVYRSRQKQTE